MTIHTTLGEVGRDCVVIGPHLQFLTASSGRCLARFEAPLARRTGKTLLRHRAYKFNFCNTDMHQQLSSAAVLKMARDEAVIGKRDAHPGRCSVAPCAFRTVCYGQYPLVLQHRWVCLSNDIRETQHSR
jgi:hypothetical protein